MYLPEGERLQGKRERHICNDRDLLTSRFDLGTGVN